MENRNSQVDSETFRAVLGNYPTGVAVVTGLDPAGEPIGMVVGTFTSVSLEPPLVAFLPMKTSRTFNQLREASAQFCINILAADQEPICRHLASYSENKFATVPWHKSPAGNPVINDVVAWIDCEYANVVDAGDHYIVLGAVKTMSLERDSSPLLFFQRGYGRFSASSLMMASNREVLHQVRLAEMAREEIDSVARELRAGCSVVSAVGQESVYVAVADHSEAQLGKNRLGVRVPIVPPLGTLFVGAGNAISVADWLARLGKNGAEAAERAQLQLERVQERGWSIALLGDLTADALEKVVELYSCPHRTPEQERQFLNTLSKMFDLHEPVQIDQNKNYDVLHLSVPVRCSSGETAFVLRLSELPSSLLGAEVDRYLERLRMAAAKVEVLLENFSG
ncbi:MAG: flavin reductase family protein [Alcaligenaceae bacterium]|nr:flavin reductase family protein [Alcaligenaceae bacterium]